MKKLFNSKCDLCHQFRPRCASVFLRLSVRKAARYRRTPRVLCEECRAQRRGAYRLEARHK